MTKFKFPFRLIFSVVAGIITAAVFTLITHFVLYTFGIFPKPFEPIFEKKYIIPELIFHSFFAIVAAFVTAHIAREKARKAVFILGSKEAIMWVLGIILLWQHSPPWVSVTKAILGPPLAWFGGKLYQFYQKKYKLSDIHSE
jgi:hypothetical protein